jgi:hypothetical protein
MVRCVVEPTYDMKTVAQAAMAAEVEDVQSPDSKHTVVPPDSNSPEHKKMMGNLKTGSP